MPSKTGWSKIGVDEREAMVAREILRLSSDGHMPSTSHFDAHRSHPIPSASYILKTMCSWKAWAEKLGLKMAKRNASKGVPGVPSTIERWDIDSGKVVYGGLPTTKRVYRWDTREYEEVKVYKGGRIT